jgi:hypothetical protein
MTNNNMSLLSKEEQKRSRRREGAKHYVGRMEKRRTVGRNGNHKCRTRSRMFVFNGDFDLGSSRVFIFE